jgi:hypothetical protein
LTCDWKKRAWPVIDASSREGRRTMAGDKSVRETLVDLALRPNQAGAGW